MDFAIAYDAFSADMTFNPADSLANNVWLSLNVRRGSFFAAPQFGSRLHLLQKNTAKTAELAVAYAQEALKWLLDTGRATSIDVSAQRDPVDFPNALLLNGTVVQADGRVFTFKQFVGVA